MIRPVNCFVIECDDCRGDLGEDADYIVHYDTHDAALTGITEWEWTVTENGHIRCRRCSAVAFCAAFDHTWDFWAPCSCNAHVPSHAANGCPMMRICLHCGHLESANLADLPTIDEPSIDC